jgi:hypothetical protein
VDGGDDLHTWRVAANTFNKQFQTADKGCSSSLRVGWGLTTPHKIPACYEALHRKEGRIITEWILEKQGMKVWIGFIWLRIGTSGRLLWTQ